MKAIPSINRATSSGGTVCNAPESFMMQYRKDAFSDRLDFSSGVATDKVAVVIGNKKASSRLRDLSTISPNAWQSALAECSSILLLTFFSDLIPALTFSLLD